MESLPKRKRTRLARFDYNQNGQYFITICAHNRKRIFGEIVGGGVYDAPQIVLSTYGMVVNKYIQQIGTQYANIRIDNYVIMPNHIHCIIAVSQPFVCTDNTTNGSSRAPNPTNATIPKFISLFKRYCNREIGHNIFQRSFHDHIIRGENDYTKIWNYIDTNPQKWNEDCFYVP